MTNQNLTPGQAAILEGVIDTAGPADVAPQQRSPEVAIGDLDDRELAQLISLLLQEQEERAIAASDPDALTESGFRTMFNSRGDALEPELVGGILVCAGSLKNTSSTSHVCSFAHVDDSWCWEHPDNLGDEVRKTPIKGKEHQRSITLIPATEGTKVDFVTCRMTAREGHRAQKSISYVVSNGALEITDTRTVPSTGRGR